MYAIVKTGGKQYKVAPGDILEIEKLDVEPGTKVALDAICVVDGEKVEADPAAAGKTKVEAIVLDQFKGEKQLVFKFKKRKNYKKMRGHRQNLTRVRIESVGSAKAPAAKAAVKKQAAKPKAATEKPAAKAVATAAADAE
ncbi:MAG: 50S ribosomal protein L21 [Raoultibacter sp.]